MLPPFPPAPPLLPATAMNSILVTRKLPSSVLNKLESVGDVDLYAGDVAMPPEELRSRIVGKRAVVTMISEQIDKHVLDLANDLKIVANARSRGVIVTNTPDVLTDSVADFTWALILAVTRRLSEGERVIRRNGWKGWAFDFMLGTELRGKQLGLVGFGRIARAVAARASAFGVRVACNSRRDDAHSSIGQLSLDRLLNTSDIVSLHVPLTPETKHLIDKRALTRMKRSAYLINTSRGPVVDEEALAWALEHRLIAGAALDVYEREPDINPALLNLENVLLVPHLGSGTIETRTAMADLAVDNVVAVLSGKPPLTPVGS
jgi:glyoxylate reductase